MWGIYFLGGAEALEKNQIYIYNIYIYIVIIGIIGILMGTPSIGMMFIIYYIM
jgi:hypothetical protein